MRFSKSLVLAALLTATTAHAAGPDEDYVRIYDQIQRADQMLSEGQSDRARNVYEETLTSLQKLEKSHPSWNTRIVQYRLTYVQSKLAGIPRAKPATTTEPDPASTNPPADPNAEVIAALKANLARMEAEKSLLQGKLNEALQAQPAAVDPRELARAEARVQELEKEKDVLKVSLSQAQAKQADPGLQAELKRASQALAEAQKQLLGKEEVIIQITREKKSLESLKGEVDQLKVQLAAAPTKEQLDSLHVDLIRTEEAARASAKRAAQFEAAMNSLKTENDALKTPGINPDEGLRQQVEGVNKILAEARGQIAERDAALEKVKVEAAKVPILKAENETLRVEARRAVELRIENDNLRTEIEKAKAAAPDPVLVRKVDDLTASLVATRAALAQRETAVAKAGEAGVRIQALESENQALRTRLEKPVKPTSSDAEKQLAALRETVKGSADKIEFLEAANAALKQELESVRMAAAARTNLPPPSAVSVAVVEPPKKELPETPLSAKEKTRIKQLEKERDDLRKKLKETDRKTLALKADLQAAQSRTMSNQVTSLKARIETYEAQKVPYTREELALFKTGPVAMPRPAVKSIKAQKTGAPTGAAPLAAEGRQLLAAHKWEEASRKFQDARELDPSNAGALAGIAAVQVEQNKLEEAEATLSRALKIDPEDAYANALNGIVHYRGGRFDLALEHLSKAARLDAASPETQNYLGLTLSQKGLRIPAETALRRAIVLSPGYGAAHHNLAVVYATQKPPAPELSRFHYEKALAAGHAANKDLEKLLNPPQVTATP